MNIIYIKSNFVTSEDVMDAFSVYGCNLIFLEVPPSDKEKQEHYLQQLLTQIKQEEPVFVFSLNFYPFLSLACGVLQLPYVCWLVDGYHKEYYDVSVRNAWNYVFVADSSLYLELKELGVGQVHFLPLAAPEIRSEVTDRKTVEEYDADISCIGTILAREELPENILAPAGALKDVTKGYLEGCIACQYQSRKLSSMAAKLPYYVREDLEKTYPPKLEGSMETISGYYDHTYFDEFITYASRSYYLQALAKENIYSKIHHYSRSRGIISPAIQNRGFADYKQEIFRIVQKSKLNVVMTHYSFRTGICDIAWMIMASGGFLLSNEQKDYKMLLPAEIVTFEDIYEMKKKAKYYYEHEDERKDISGNILREIKQKHTYKHRIEELFSILVQ